MIVEHQSLSKAAFENRNNGFALDGRKIVLLVSVGQRYHEDNKLLATIELINRSRFGFCTIAVADTLQRHNYRDRSPEEAYVYSLQMGEEWLSRNSSTIRMLSVDYDVLRWDDALHDEAYADLRRRVEREYHDNQLYRDSVNTTIGKFIDRLGKRDKDANLKEAFSGCLTYLIEECPIIMPMWASQGYDYVIYPQSMTSAMSMTYQIFVKPFYQDKCKWLSLKFK